jgi:predicted nicotinamide N-methyase
MHINTRIIKTFGISKIFFANLNDHFININQINEFNIFVFQDFSQCAAVTATDIDALALQVTRLLARAHDVAVAVAVLDLLDGGAIERSLVDVDVVIAADVVYNRALGAAMKQLLERCRQRDIDVVVADSGRPFFEASGLRAVAAHEVPVPVGVEGTGTRRVTVYTQA